MEKLAVLSIPIVFLIISLIYYFRHKKKNTYTLKKLYLTLIFNFLAWILAAGHLLNLI